MTFIKIDLILKVHLNVNTKNIKNFVLQKVVESCQIQIVFKSFYNSQMTIK